MLIDQTITHFETLFLLDIMGLEIMGLDILGTTPSKLVKRRLVRLLSSLDLKIAPCATCDGISYLGISVTAPNISHM